MILDGVMTLHFYRHMRPSTCMHNFRFHIKVCLMWNFKWFYLWQHLWSLRWPAEKKEASFEILINLSFIWYMPDLRLPASPKPNWPIILKVFNFLLFFHRKVQLFDSSTGISAKLVKYEITGNSYETIHILYNYALSPLRSHNIGQIW